jgi:hypothetical protein
MSFIKKAKISKGYRLRNSTHKLIRKLQVELNSTQDKVVSMAIRKFYKELKEINNHIKYERVIK